MRDVPVLEAPPAPPPPVPPVTKEAGARRGRVMVIDDERAILTVVKRILSSEHDVFAFDNAAAALEVLSGGARFDVILCDLMMPNMSGMDLHGELGRVASSEQRRMVFMTGGTFTVRTRAFVESVGNRILEKPIGGLVLREIVRAHAR